LSFKAVLDAEAWRALIDLLTCNTAEPVVEFSNEGLYARNMSAGEESMYELSLRYREFDEYVYPPQPLHAKIYSDSAKDALKGAKGDLALTVEGEDVKLDGAWIGKLLKPEEYKPPKLPKLEYVNEAKIDAVRFRKFLYYARKAISHHEEHKVFVGFSWDRESRKLSIAAFSKDAFIEYVEDVWLISEVGASAASVYQLLLLSPFFPPSALWEAKEIARNAVIHMTGRNDYPIYVVSENWYPSGVYFAFWLAAFIAERGVSFGEEFRRMLEAPKPTPIVSATSTPEKMELLLDLIFSNHDEPDVFFDREKVESRNLDFSHTTYSRVLASDTFFERYTCNKPTYVKLGFRERIKHLLALSKLFEKNVELSVADEKVFYDRTYIGFVKDEQAFAVPEAKIPLKNSFKVYVKDFAKTLRAMTEERKRAKLTPAFYIAIAYDTSWAEKASRFYFCDEEVFEEVKPTVYEPNLVERFVSAFDIGFVKLFFPPSLVRRDVAATLATETMNPLQIAVSPEPSLRFTAYVAPRIDATWRVARRLGWLKPLTEEAVLEVVKAERERITIGAIRDKLTKAFYEVKDLESVVEKLVREKKLVEKREGGIPYYSSPEVVVKLKPLTEEVVLETIRRLCTAWDTDAVGYSELEAALGREYQTEPLYSILRGLEAKGLVVSKGWPEKRRGLQRVEMRGYWSLKPSEPEEAVKKAEEVKLKPLTDEVVLSTLKNMNLEVRGRVSFDDLAARLAAQGYDVTNLSDVLAKLRKDEKVSVDLAGKWGIKDIEEPPTPPGYRRVHFKRDMVRYIGMDRRYYGPFKACEEATIEETFAEAFRRHGYAEILEGAAPTPKAEEAAEKEAETWEEAKKRYEKWRVE
jgi:hypothetical protein